MKLSRYYLKKENEWERSAKGIDFAFQGTNILTKKESILLANAMECLNLKTIRKVIKDVIFISAQYTDGWCISLKYLKHKKSIIFFSHKLQRMKKEDAMFLILHEIGHYILKHKSPLYSDLSEKECKKQEKEADDFAAKYLYDTIEGLLKK